MRRPLRPVQLSNGTSRLHLRWLVAATAGLLLAVPAIPVRVAAEPPEPQRAADKPSDAEAESSAFAVHIASFRTMRGVRKAWPRLVRAHPEFLYGLRARVTHVDLGPKKGRFYRLKAGPLPSRAFAKELCKSRRKRHLYCAVMHFTGRKLG